MQHPGLRREYGTHLLKHETDSFNSWTKIMVESSICKSSSSASASKITGAMPVGRLRGPESPRQAYCRERLRQKIKSIYLQECTIKCYRIKLNFNWFMRERLLSNINICRLWYFAPNLSGAFIKTVKITVTNKYERDT